MAKRNAKSKSKAPQSKAPHFWGEEETHTLINVLKEMNIMAFIDGRKCRDSDTYKRVSRKLSEAGGYTRTADQCKHRWKTIKKAYYEAKKKKLHQRVRPVHLSLL